MTIFFPDVSEWDSNIHIQPDTVIVMAKATQADRYLSSQYTRFRQEAQDKGAFFCAYHWLNHGNIANQAQWCVSHVGNTPLMIDSEDVPGNTGYNGSLTIDDIVAFHDAVVSLGGNPFLVYLPHWYWSDKMGSPSLVDVKNTGMKLVSSNYTKYSDTGPGWSGYGGMDVSVWQYTDAFAYGGGHVDMNAFRGTVDEFISLSAREDFMVTDQQFADLVSKVDALFGAMARVERIVTAEATSVAGPGYYPDGTWTASGTAPQNQSGDIPLFDDSFVPKVPSVGRVLLDAVHSLSAVSGGLTDADRALLKSVTDAVTALDSRLATP